MPEPVPEKIGRYEIRRELGRGMMGVVYEAFDPSLNRIVALKVIRLLFATSGEEQDSFERRFLSEARIAASLSHPGIVVVHDVDRDPGSGVLFIALERLEGEPLSRVLADNRRPPWRQALSIVGRVAEALAYAHGRGVVHRDIKPANIMLCSQGGEQDVVKLLDFGLVKEFAMEEEAQLTGVSTLVGTPQYMAPESILDPRAADGRSDLYALGAVAYYLLAGLDVFNGKSVLELCVQHLHQTPEPLTTRGVDVPAELEALVLACLDKEPNRRPASAAELGRRLAACVVEPWDSEKARVWWLEHQAALDGDQAQSPGVSRTIEVNGPRRSPAPNGIEPPLG